MKQYVTLLNQILSEGTDVSTRQGTKGCKMIFAPDSLRFDMRDGFPIVTCRRIPYKMAIRELLVFISGANDLKSMLDADVPVWTDDAYRRYMKAKLPTPKRMFKEDFIKAIQNDLSFNERWGSNLYPYGDNWRHYSKPVAVGEYNDLYCEDEIDQLRECISNLRDEPFGRRHIISGHNPATVDKYYLPQCHGNPGIQFNCRLLSFEERYQILRPTFDRNGEALLYTDDLVTPDTLDRENIPSISLDLWVHIRSSDTVLGLPFNIIQYAALLMMFGQQLNYQPGQLVITLGNAHIYKEHINEELKEMIQQPNRTLPIMELTGAKSLFSYSINDFKLSEGYIDVLPKYSFPLIT